MPYSTPIKTLAGCDGRYPTAAEEAAVLGWAAALPRRLHAANLLAQHEAAIVRAGVDAIKGQFPRFAPQHERAYDKTERDMTMLLRYAAQGMLAGDPELPRHKTYVWFGTIVRSFGMTPGIMRVGCQGMADAARAKLPADVYAEAAPFLARLVADMSAFPEPLKPTVD